MLVFKEFINNNQLVGHRLRELIDEVKVSYPLLDFRAIDKNFSMNTCVDIGCNIGAFSSLASHYFSSLFGFEAGYMASAHSTTLTTRCPNVRIYNLAVGKNTGDVLRLTSADDKDCDQTYSGDATIRESSTGSYENVLSINLESIYNLIDKDFIDYLKIDCEGSEYDFLLDQDLSQIGVIAGETHGFSDKTRAENKELKESLLEHISLNFNVSSIENNFFAVNKKFNIDPSSLLYTEEDETLTVLQGPPWIPEEKFEELAKEYGMKDA